jgi:hypothetical protein
LSSHFVGWKEPIGGFSIIRDATAFRRRLLRRINTLARTPENSYQNQSVNDVPEWHKSLQEKHFFP